VTEDHLKLLRRAWVDSWCESEGVYGGAPGVNARANADENPPVEVGERLMRLHVETMVALQIMLATGEFRPGPYALDTAGCIDWRREENGQ
jgi:hypothetical protein